MPVAAPSLATVPFAVRSYADFDAWQASEAVLGQDLRYLCELGLAQQVSAQACLSGVCWLCRRRTDFAFEPVPPGQLPNWREQLACNGCGLIARVRLALALAFAELEGVGAEAVAYSTEQVTEGFAAIQARYPASIGSEYAPDRLAADRLRRYLQTRRGGEELRLENVTALTLADESVDAVLSFDVLEHVPDYRAALREFHRVLRPGRVLVLSVPLASSARDTVVRATLEADGSVRHLLEPEYHGDPTTPQGCLAFYNFGWALLDEIRAAGFAEAGMVDAWSPASAFLGTGGIVLARKPRHLA